MSLLQNNSEFQKVFSTSFDLVSISYFFDELVMDPFTQSKSAIVKLTFLNTGHIEYIQLTIADKTKIMRQLSSFLVWTILNTGNKFWGLSGQKKSILNTKEYTNVENQECPKFGVIMIFIKTIRAPRCSDFIKLPPRAAVETKRLSPCQEIFRS